MFTNKPDHIHSQSAKETALSDYFLVTYNINQIDKLTKVPGKANEKGSAHGFHKLNLQSKKIDWDSLGKSYKTDWRKMLVGKTEIEAKTMFHEYCVKKTSEYAPKKVGKSSERKRRIPRDRKILMRRRAKIDQQIVKYPFRAKLKEERVEIKRKLEFHKSEKKKRNKDKAIIACKKNRKFFFSYAKKNLARSDKT